MSILLSVSSGLDAKIFFFPKSEKVVQAVQLFLKEVGVHRDYRKNFLKQISFATDVYEETSTKDGSVVVAAFIGKEKIILQIRYSSQHDEEISRLFRKHFT